jgi:hypothetical protein
MLLCFLPHYLMHFSEYLNFFPFFCATFRVFGPMLQPGLNTTMGWIAGMAKNGR